MKKILLTSFYYSPCTLTPAQRITYWAENFYKMGFYPIVVTRAWSPEIKTHQDTKLPLGTEPRIVKFPTHEVHYLPFEPGMLDKAYLHFGENFLRPLFILIKLLDVLLAKFTLRFTSFSNFLPYMESLIRSEKPEKLIISGEPFYLFRLGYTLNKNYGISWFADYRDDWSTNQLQMEKQGGAIRKWVAKIESRYEKKWVSTSENIISVSDEYTQRISTFLNKPGFTVQNGFEEDLLKREGQHLAEKFTLVYSGVIYPSQDLKMILEVLDICQKEGKPFKLLFLGAAFDVKEKKRLENLIPDHLKSMVEVTQRIPRQEAIDVLLQSHAFLGIAYGEMKGIPSSKLYEYVALRKPVLLCPTDQDVMENILTETGLGFFCKNPSEGAEQVRQMMNLYKDQEQLNSLRDKAKSKASPYSRLSQLKILADQLGK